MKNAKKTCLLLLASSALLLTGCGNGSDTGEVSQPKGGTETTLVKSSAKLAKAADGTVAAGAFGASLTLPTLKAELATKKANVALEIANANLSFAANGFTSTKAADVNASLSASVDKFAFNATFATSGDSEKLAEASSTAAAEPTKIDVSFGKASIAAYIKNTNVYVDISNDTVYNAIISAGKEAVGSASDAEASAVSAYLASLPRKCVLKGLVGDELMPIYKVTEAKTSIAQYATMLSAVASKVEEFFSVKDYDDGTSSIYGKFDAAAVANLMAHVQGGAGADYSSMANSMLANFGADEKMNFSFLLTYDASHILGLKLYGDVYGDIKENKVVVGHASFTARINLDLTYGSDVKVLAPTESDYKEVELPIE